MPNNTTATGGVLVPSTGPTEGQDFKRFIQSVLVSVSGLPGQMVRPSHQKNPPPRPDVDVDWLAFWITHRRPDANPFTQQNEDGSALLIRHEDVEIQLTAYGPNCQRTLGLIRDSLNLSQNRDQLRSVDMGVGGFEDINSIPEKVNECWYERADMTMTLRREIKRTYPVLHFVSAYGTILGNRAITTLTVDWSA